MARTLAFALLITLRLLAANPDATSLTFNGAAKMITTAGGRPLIMLTGAAPSTSGSVFTTTAVAFNSLMTFTTFFQFRMEHPGGIGAADGLAFVLQTEANTALGGGGGGIGYLNVTPSVVVEFDTYFNPGWDINDNHVAITTLGQLNGIDPQTPYGVTNCLYAAGTFGCMGNGDLWSVWIEYDGTILSVAVADGSSTRPPNLITYPIDIPGLLGQTTAYVGFSAATGGGWESHQILNWQFSETHPPN